MKHTSKEKHRRLLNSVEVNLLSQLFEYISCLDLRELQSSKVQKLFKDLELSAVVGDRGIFLGSRGLLADKEALFFPESLKIISSSGIEKPVFETFEKTVRDYERRLEKELSSPEKGVIFLYEAVRNLRPETVVVSRKTSTSFQPILFSVKEEEKVKVVQVETSFFSDAVAAALKAAVGEKEISKPEKSQYSGAAALSSAVALFLLEKADFELSERAFERLRPKVLIRSPKALRKAPLKIQKRVLEEVKQRKRVRAL